MADRQEETNVDSVPKQKQITKAVKDTLPETFLQAAGAVPDFPSLGEIRSGVGADSPREAL